MSKKILFLIVMFNLISASKIALSDVIPLKKPVQTKEETQKKILDDQLRPLSKPIIQNETKIIEKEVLIKKEEKNPLI